ncbi:hypothetical protein Pcinc_042873 [Petrolisthes cinctipes]|uniref:G-protein coupled receptors family 1 profile domain-containing protein n=1 Tax=Petrolisthes cinctipes TaxID=88211 RepID=A0AAE1EFI2_PETCI|nr:hypothetical protein Pcinc_042873 [Petrolisthes cinctipes]
MNETVEVDLVHMVTYRRVLPFLVTLGLVTNLVALVVLCRPSLRHTKVNGYLIVLTVCDFFVCVSYIPVITTITGCVHYSYTDALYFAHFGWTLVGVFQTIGIYTILWLSLDRFMAVWMYDLYPRIQQKPHVNRNRMILTAICCLAIHVVYMIDGKAECTSDVDHHLDCKHGRWLSTSGYELSYSEQWHKMYRFFFSLVIRWIPSTLLLGFNAGLVVGVARGRLSFPSASHPNAERNLVTITICITFSYIFFSLPIVVYITAFASKLDDRCSGLHSKEILRAVGNCFQLLEHIVHVFFMAGLNSAFRKELKVFLRLEQSTVEKEDYAGGIKGEEEVSRKGKGSQLTPRLERSTNGAAVNLRLDHSVTPNPSTRNTMLEPGEDSVMVRDDSVIVVMMVRDDSVMVVMMVRDDSVVVVMMVRDDSVMVVMIVRDDSVVVVVVVVRDDSVMVVMVVVRIV